MSSVARLATAGFLEFDIVPGLSSGSMLAVSILRAGMVSTVCCEDRWL